MSGDFIWHKFGSNLKFFTQRRMSENFNKKKVRMLKIKKYKVDVSVRIDLGTSNLEIKG